MRSMYRPYLNVPDMDGRKANHKRIYADRNVHFLGGRCDGAALRSLRLPRLSVVCVQFPDPGGAWAKHAERRVVNADLAEALAELLPAGGEAYVCSDVRAAAVQMRTELLGARGGAAFALHAAHAATGRRPPVAARH